VETLQAASILGAMSVRAASGPIVSDDAVELTLPDHRGAL